MWYEEARVMIALLMRNSVAALTIVCSYRKYITLDPSCYISLYPLDCMHHVSFESRRRPELCSVSVVETVMHCT